MKLLNGSFTQRFNYSAGIDGPLFRGRYKSILIDKDNYLLSLSRYIHLNPVKSGIVKMAETYRWSSMRYFLNPHVRPSWLKTNMILNLFPDDKQIKYYKEFVEQKKDEKLVD